MKVICIHHRLVGYSSHHFNEAHGLMRELGRRGRELILLVNVQASPRIVAELNADAVLDDPTFRLEWSFEVRSRRFKDVLHRRERAYGLRRCRGGRAPGLSSQACRLS